MSKHHTPRLELPGVPSVRFVYQRRRKEEGLALRQLFNHGVRADFHRHLAANFREELRAVGFTEQQIATLAAGKHVEGYNVHHKHPLGDSGTNDFSNLVLMDELSHRELHLRVDAQIERLGKGQGTTIRLPEPVGSLYVHPSLIPERVQTRSMKPSAEAEADYRPGVHP